MKRLKEVLKGLNYTVHRASENLEIKGLHTHSAKVREGYAFIALKGESFDGMDFLPEALKNGATCVIVEKGKRGLLSSDIPVVEVENLKEHLPTLFINFEGGNISSNLYLCGITGTNGKTTVAFLIHNIWDKEGVKSVLVSSVGIYVGKKEYPSTLTTPDVADLYYAMRKGKEEGADKGVIEVTSIGLDRKRCDWLQFDAGIFTNISRDHLDYHRTLDDYIKAKSKFFKEVLVNSEKKKKIAVINVDDPYHNIMIPENEVEVVKYSLVSPLADVYCRRYHYDEEGMEFEIKTEGGVLYGKTHLKGVHNLYNILAAVAFSLRCGIKEETVIKGIEEFKGVPGRLEEVRSKKGAIYIDYAHTPDALEKVLKSLRFITKRRLIVVFGCGGNRDRGKRPEMGKIASTLADVLIITSDNPRNENPLSIIEDILKGVKCKKFDGERGYIVEERRDKAIRKGVELMEDGDVLLIAGKGHERYQVLKDKAVPFSDREEVEKALRDVESE